MKKSLILACLLSLLVVVFPASAAVVIDFAGAGALGAVTCSGGNCSGSGVKIDQMIVVGSASADGTYDLSGALAVGTLNPNGSAALDFDTSTGSFHIVGDVCKLGFDGCTAAGDILVPTTTLVNGTGSSCTGLIVAGANNVSISCTEPDTKDATLLSALGIAGNTSFALMNFNLNGFRANSTDPYTATSTDVQNIGSPIPEPTSVLLLGTVLLGVTQLVRRRARKV